MNATKKWTALSAYIILVAVVFLYTLFPSETVKSYVGYRLGAMVPQVALEIDRLQLGIPPGLSFRDVAVNYLEKPAVKFDRLIVAPDYLSLMTADFGARFSGQLAGGSFSGRTSLIDSASGAMDGKVTFSAIELSELPILGTLVPLKTSGKTSGEIRYAPTGKSTANITLTDCSFDLQQPIMGIRQLTFTRIEADAEMTVQQVNINRIDFSGQQASGSGSGTLILRQPVEDSRINLSGTLKPHPSLMQSVGALLPQRYLKDGGIPVRITGTLERPSFSFR